MRKYYWVLLLALGIAYFLLDIRILKYAVVALFGLAALLIHRFRVNPFADKKAASAISTGKNEGRDAKKARPGPIPRLRLWLFRVIAAVVFPVLAFVLIELGLRVAGYGYPSHAIIKLEAKGKSYYCDNMGFNWRFFPRNISRGFTPFIFPAAKPDGTHRIFVLGASAARGTPDDAFSLGRMLWVMLREAYPGVNFEVVTVAAAAINSHVVLEMAKDCARCEPDMVIVYLGNNEVTGPYGAGTVFAPLSGNLSLIRAGIALKGTRLGQLLSGIVGVLGKEDRPAVWRGMGMFLEKQVRAEDAGVQTVYRHFRSNLEDIVRAGRGGGAKVILCTVGNNLKDNPPFGSLHRADLSQMEKGKWDELYEEGVGNESAGEYAEAVKRYLAAAAIDDSYADLHFRLGRCYWALGAYDKARESYIKARELDTLRFRADNRINEIIRSVAGRNSDDSRRMLPLETGPNSVERTAWSVQREANGKKPDAKRCPLNAVYLADIVKVFEQNSPEGIAGEELFYEHVHFNFKGTYLLAQAVFGQVEEALGERIRAMRADERQFVSEAECAERLAYTEWDRYRIADEILNGFIKKPPFTNQLYYKERVEQMTRDLGALKANLTRELLEKSAGQYRKAIEDRPDDWLLHYKYGKLLAEDLKEYQAAAQEYRLVQDLLPHSWVGYNALGSVLYAEGDINGAIQEFEKAIRTKPTCSYAHYDLGRSYRRKGNTDKAIEHYSEAVRYEPDCVPAYNNWAEIMAQEGKVDEAIEILRRGLVYCPQSVVLHGNLGSLLKLQGQRAEAIKELETALQLDPNSAAVRKALESLLR